MLEIVRAVTPSAELSVVERKVLATALMDFLGDHRKAWEAVRSITVDWTAAFESNIAAVYLAKIENEILKTCREIILLIDQQLQPSALAAESAVYYLTLKGDIFCYIAEFGENAEEELAALAVYKEAKVCFSFPLRRALFGLIFRPFSRVSLISQVKAKAELPWLSPARLGLALTLSVFYCEVMNSPEKAVRVAGKVSDLFMLLSLLTSKYQEIKILLSLSLVFFFFF
ncbi:14-3-3-like protein GF14-F [Apostasia shenzhenica]|uniref:14-3-3-like protein GF14-F n=1 Tax=Apostasia shenzhenica TaxID=1088818 RepID=A0A2H9ZUD7_9ASPA|nr:14-3-3-like protein GF14-F [Apostasia shenzhenica]